MPARKDFADFETLFDNFESLTELFADFESLNCRF